MVTFIGKLECPVCGEMHNVKATTKDIFYTHCKENNIIFVNFKRVQNADGSRKKSI